MMPVRIRVSASLRSLACQWAPPAAAAARGPPAGGLRLRNTSANAAFFVAFKTVKS
jgi:hypothetical protein